MGEIYTHAERVIFWLGNETRATEHLFDGLEKLQQKFFEQAYKSFAPTDDRWKSIWSEVTSDLFIPLMQQGIMDILERSWWERVWIIQEVANAKTAAVVCGQRSVHVHVFAIAPWLIDITPSAHCQAILDIMPRPSRMHSWWCQSRTLHTLLNKFKRSKASDPRDMVFALLGIASDAQNAPDLQPNYEHTESDVIFLVVDFLYGRNFGTSERSAIPRTILEFIDNLPPLSISHVLQNVLSYKDEDLTVITSHLQPQSSPLADCLTWPSWVFAQGLVNAVRNESRGPEIILRLLEYRNSGIAYDEPFLKELISRPLHMQRETIKHLVERLEFTDKAQDYFSKVVSIHPAAEWMTGVLFDVVGTMKINLNILENVIKNSDKVVRTTQFLLQQEAAELDKDFKHEFDVRLGQCSSEGELFSELLRLGSLDSLSSGGPFTGWLVDRFMTRNMYTRELYRAGFTHHRLLAQMLLEKEPRMSFRIRDLLFDTIVESFEYFARVNIPGGATTRFIDFMNSIKSSQDKVSITTLERWFKGSITASSLSKKWSNNPGSERITELVLNSLKEFGLLTEDLTPESQEKLQQVRGWTYNWTIFNSYRLKAQRTGRGPKRD
jgi:hypothetical protein